jgi:potassium uptake Trk family protein
MAIFGSICLYIRGGVRYIDALFLASGASTQSGLNTIDINRLNTWQQVVLYISAMMCNPITINSFVVFLRLYWFEKRFQHVVREASKNRRSIAKTLSKAKTGERDLDGEERGVDGRKIVVMHDTTTANGMTDDTARPEDLHEHLEKAKILAQEERARSSNDSSSGRSPEAGKDDSASPTGGGHRPQIKFADKVTRSNGMTDDDLRVPVQRSHEDHIAFLERQRNSDNGEVLRIPGPRDADAGLTPEAVDESDPMTQVISRRASTFGESRTSGDVVNLNTDDHEAGSRAPRRQITIAEPVRSPTTQDVAEHVAEDTLAAKHVLNALRLRKPRILKGEKLHQDETHPHASRQRSNTFQSIRTALSRDKEEGMPYLSWEPTVGRNSAFVDLTEAQREELGGIEYRSLKSLALILTIYFWGFSLFGLVSLVPWILHSKTYGQVVTNDGQGRTWWAIFTANSAFTDLGFTITPDSMISFQTAIWPLILMSFLIIVGNTGFPIMLRIIIWVTSKYVPKESGIWEELQFLLDHPRRCFTLLFPAKATWWLFWILIILNGLDLIFFVVLDVSFNHMFCMPVLISSFSSETRLSRSFRSTSEF